MPPFLADTTDYSLKDIVVWIGVSQYLIDIHKISHKFVSLNYINASYSPLQSCKLVCIHTLNLPYSEVGEKHPFFSISRILGYKNTPFIRFHGHANSTQNAP